MEALDDLLSDSDYEGPASKLGFGPRYGASSAGPARYAGSSGAAARALEPIEEPDEATSLAGSRNPYTPSAGDAWDDDYSQGDCKDDGLCDEPPHYFQDETFESRRRLWDLSALGMGAGKEELPLDDYDAVGEVHAVNGYSGRRRVADLDEFDDIEELEREIEALAAAPGSQKTESWWASGSAEAGVPSGYSGLGSYGTHGLEAGDLKAPLGGESEIADLLHDSKPAPVWAPPSTQTTMYEGGSQSPQSEEIFAEPSWRSSPRSPRSAEIRRIQQDAEAELDAKSHLVSGFSRDSTDEGSTFLGGSATAASPTTHAESSYASPPMHGAGDGALAADGPCADGSPSTGYGGCPATYAGRYSSTSDSALGDGIGAAAAALPTPVSVGPAATGSFSTAGSDAGTKGGGAGIAGSSPLDSDAGAASTGTTGGGAAASSSKARTFLKKGARNPRSVLPSSSGSASPSLAKASSMPRLIPRASSTPPSATRAPLDLPSDALPAATRAATAARKAAPANRPTQDFQVDVRVPLSTALDEGAKPPTCGTHDLADTPRDMFAMAGHAAALLSHDSDSEEDYLDKYGLDQPALSPNALSPGFGHTPGYRSHIKGSTSASGYIAPDPRGSSAARGTAGSNSGAAALAAAIAAKPTSKAALSLDPEDEFGGNCEDEWADSLPWDCRGLDPDLDLELDQYAAPAAGRHAAPLPGEPPTSRVVNAYFNAATSTGSGRSAAVKDKPQARRAQHDGPASRHSHWEGDDAYGALYGDGGQPKRSSSTCGSRGQGHAAESQVLERNGGEGYEHEEKMHLSLLQEQIKKYERETELLKKVRAQAEQSERDIAREREKLHKEVEAERQALHAEFDAEQAAVKRERKRLMQGAEKQRQQLAEDREAAEERKKLRERTEELEEELREKEKRWTRTVDRLTRQVGDLTTKNRELEEEVRRSGLQIQQAQCASGRSSATTTSARGRRSSSATRATTPTPKSGARKQAAGAEAGPAWQAWQAQPGALRPSGSEPRLQRRPSADGSGAEYGVAAQRRAVSGRQGMRDHDLLPSDGARRDSEVKEVRTTPDGKTQRTFWDGRSEIEFANGLRKVLHPDGRTQVFFQNGDEKELRPDGVIKYHYASTKAVQTTLPDGCELYQFQDGQFERRHPDGSTEIHFPNGTTKRIQSDGSEEVVFADGTVQKSNPT